LMIIPIIPQFLVAFIFNGLAEEFGWRGYALPQLQVRWNALVSSLILGILWASWHLPVFLIPGAPLYQTDFWTWAPWIILSSIFYTWIFNNTKGSVLAAALFHAMSNTRIVWCCGSSIWHSYGVFLLAVVLIVFLFGAKNLVREQHVS
jgi:membrane protease YdiL (CAAX protease family)